MRGQFIQNDQEREDLPRRRCLSGDLMEVREWVEKGAFHAEGTAGVKTLRLRCACHEASVATAERKE